jgi:hypothetical protein
VRVCTAERRTDSLHRAMLAYPSRNLVIEGRDNRFLRLVPMVERASIAGGIQIIKYWFGVSQEQQTRRFEDRARDPRNRVCCARLGRHFDTWSEPLRETLAAQGNACTSCSNATPGAGKKRSDRFCTRAAPRLRPSHPGRLHSGVYGRHSRGWDCR